jgi:hypothetical protein
MKSSATSFAAAPFLIAHRRTSSSRQTGSRSQAQHDRRATWSSTSTTSPRHWKTANGLKQHGGRLDADALNSWSMSPRWRRPTGDGDGLAAGWALVAGFATAGQWGVAANMQRRRLLAAEPPSGGPRSWDGSGVAALSNGSRVRGPTRAAKSNEEDYGIEIVVGLGA